MSLQEQVIQAMNGLSDRDLLFLLDMIQRYVKPIASGKCQRKIAVCAGEKWITEGYDFDEMNHEIATMFGVEE